MVSLLPDNKSINVADREYFTVHTLQDDGKAYVSKPIIGRITDAIAFHVGRRINRPGWKLRRSCRLRNRTEIFFPGIYREVKLGAGYSITLLGDGRNNPDASDSRRHGIRSGRIKNREFFKNAGNLTAGSYSSISAIDKMPRIFCYHFLEKFPLIVQISVLEEEALAEFRARETKYYWVAGVSSLVLLLVFMILFRLIINQERASKSKYESEELFSKVFMYAPIGMALVSPTGRWLKSESDNLQITRLLEGRTSETDGTGCVAPGGYWY